MKGLLFCKKTLLEALEVLRKPGAGDSSPGLQEDDFDRSVGSVGTQLSLNLNERFSEMRETDRMKEVKQKQTELKGGRETYFKARRQSRGTRHAQGHCSCPRILAVTPVLCQLPIHQ